MPKISPENCMHWNYLQSVYGNLKPFYHISFNHPVWFIFKAKAKIKSEFREKNHVVPDRSNADKEVSLRKIGTRGGMIIWFDFYFSNLGPVYMRSDPHSGPVYTSSDLHCIHLDPMLFSKGRLHGVGSRTVHVYTRSDPFRFCRRFLSESFCLTSD